MECNRTQSGPIAPRCTKFSRPDAGSACAMCRVGRQLPLECKPAAVVVFGQSRGCGRARIFDAIRRRGNSELSRSAAEYKLAAQTDPEPGGELHLVPLHR